jgi:hypothetical protein
LMKKTSSKKSRDTVPLTTSTDKLNYFDLVLH